MISKIAFAFVLCALFQVSLQVSENLPFKVIEFMGSRAMRYHHFLWHNLREHWNRIKPETQHAISKLGWAPPRPSFIHFANQTTLVNEENGSGEDFLYMHRQMVNAVNRMVADTDYERIVGWKHTPYPGDPKWPVPAAYQSGDDGFDVQINDSKTEAFFWNQVVPTEERLFDHDYLRTVSLGKFGSQLEYTIHVWLHMRFSSLGPVGCRQTFTVNPTPDIDERWDNTSYQWLGDPYSSHVNPTFWKIHGWVENHIEEWRLANGVETIQWENTWENGPEGAILEDLFLAGAVEENDADPNVSDGEVDVHLDNMRQAVQLLLADGIDTTFRFVRTSLHDHLNLQY